VLLTLACFAALPAAPAEGPARSLTPTQHLEPDHLKAVHEARERFTKQRTALWDHGLYQDYRAIIQIEAPESPFTGQTRGEIVAAAKQAGAKIVILAGTRVSPADAPGESRDGMLILQAHSDNGGRGMSFLQADPQNQSLPRDLLFPSSDANFTGHNREGATGMTIVDPGVKSSLASHLRAASGHPDQWDQAVKDFKLYQDEMLASVLESPASPMALFDAELRLRHFSVVAAHQGNSDLVIKGVAFDHHALRFGQMSTHILARELTAPAVLEALQAGRTYVAYDWLADPTGFTFVAIHNLGVFAMGDSAPASRLIGGGNTLVVGSAVPAHLKLIHEGKVVAETNATRLDFEAEKPGAYRVEAWLTVDGEERPWILSNPIYLDNSMLASAKIPPSETPAGVEVKRAIVYTDAPTPDPNKHKLDVFRPINATNAPVFFFIHGGAWQMGDRTQHFPVGNRFAKDGFVTVLPSYRLAPKSPHPAQIEDCAAALAWTVREIGKYGGDTNRIFIGGHSAGAHLAALLALDDQQLARYELSTKLVKGVIGLSGVYDLNLIGESMSSVFGRDRAVRQAASPITYAHSPAPPFLLTYCQYDYFSLPAQAKLFHAALQRAGVKSELLYLPGENHVAEVFSLCVDGDPTSAAMDKFMR